MKGLMALAIGWAALLVGAQVGVVSAQAPAPVTERFVLSGVIILDDGQGMAWLQEPTLTQNRVVTRRPGESVGPWRLTRVLENRVELEGPAGTVVVPLYNTAALGTEAAASTPSARPRPQRTSSTEVPSAVSLAPASATSEPESAPSPRVGGRANATRRVEMLTQMAERRQREGEGRQGGGEGRARAAATAPSQLQNPNVISVTPGDPSRRGGMNQLFGGQ